MEMSKKKIIEIVTVVGMVVAVVVVFGASASFMAQSHHVITPIAEAKWGPAPPALPPGAQMAVLSGDPGKTGPYAVRLKFPANYAVPAHSHPGDENVTVTSGELFLGMGNKLDKSAGTGLPVGGYAQMPAGMNHFAFTKSETTIVLFGLGPVGFTYVNPADDPRKK
jgi:quercetin dioxygenase-like cupin family protein